MEALLFLCHRIPYPPDKGDKIRAWHVLKPASQAGRISASGRILPGVPKESAEVEPAQLG